jgi:preprotein translocase subunit SecE
MLYNTGVAQLVEHWSPKPGVGSSSLSSRAKNFKEMNIKGYFQDSYTELVHKVTWPTWAELQNSATLVMVATLIIALIVAAMDFSFSRIMEFVYSLLY